MVKIILNGQIYNILLNTLGNLTQSVDGLVPGLYLVRVETGRGVVGRKVVIR